jgi:hypothetical protein
MGICTNARLTFCHTHCPAARDKACARSSGGVSVAANSSYTSAPGRPKRSASTSAFAYSSGVYVAFMNAKSLCQELCLNV